MNRTTATRRFLLSDQALLVFLALLKLMLHFVLIGRYGYHRDELYFIACGQHLDWGYVDHSPLVPWIAQASRTLFGDSLFALRLFPALAGAACVLLTGLMAWRLGAGRFGQCLAALAYIIAPAFLRTQNMLHIPTFEPLYWGLCCYLLIRLVQTGNPRYWLWIGLVAGVGLMNKPTTVFLGVGVVVGLVLTPHRKQLLSGWFWLGGLIALAVFMPNIIWQIRHDWPTLEFVRDVNARVMSRISLFEFLAGQILYLHPFSFPIWLAGLGYYLLAKQAKPYRMMGWIYVVVFVLLLAAKSKIYYLLPAYPMLLASGGVAIEAAIQRRRWNWAKPVVTVLLIAGGIGLAPVGLPVLPIDKVDRYISLVMGGLLDDVHEVTGDFHDEHGWPNQAATVARVHRRLTPQEQANCVIFAGNYGQAGAIDFFGRAYNLPRAMSGHNSYYLWGPGEASFDVVIVVGFGREALEEFFESVERADTITGEHCIENNVPVCVCRKPKVSIRQEWPRFKHYD